jgi:hypothetical protein
MDSRSIIKAKSRLLAARKAVSDLAACQDYQSFAATWYIFLFSCKGIYPVLEQGAKVSAQSRQWFGAKAAIRRADPLLQYLFQARDDDEHGINPVLENVPASVGIGVNRPGFSQSIWVNHLSCGPDGMQGQVTGADGKPVLIEVTRPHARLTVVQGRGKSYAPPEMHLGIRLESNLPLPVACAGLAYFETLIREAEGLA